MNRKQLIILWLTVPLAAIFAEFSIASVADILATSVDGKYKIIQPGEWGDGLLITHNGKVIFEIVPKYQKEIGNNSKVDLAYDSLANRGDIEKQPKAFDDITGDGKSNIFCIERPNRIANHPPWYVAIRVFSISDNEVEELPPILDSIGEGLHFDDFNKDGVLELVNTDQERYFLYSREGMPISQYVWIFDPFYKFYYQAAKMVGKEEMI